MTSANRLRVGCVCMRVIYQLKLYHQLGAFISHHIKMYHIIGRPPSRPYSIKTRSMEQRMRWEVMVMLGRHWQTWAVGLIIIIIIIITDLYSAFTSEDTEALSGRYCFGARQMWVRPYVYLCFCPSVGPRPKWSDLYFKLKSKCSSALEAFIATMRYINWHILHLHLHTGCHSTFLTLKS